MIELSVEEAQLRLHAQITRGKIVTCPCCGQTVNIYKRALDSAMARLLIWIVQHHENDPRWFDTHEFPLIQGRRGGGDFAKLRHWGFLLECEKEAEDADQRTSGLWRPTPAGTRFVAHPTTLAPSHVYLLNNIKVGMADTDCTIIKALGKKFSYAELMAAW